MASDEKELPFLAQAAESANPELERVEVDAPVPLPASLSTPLVPALAGWMPLVKKLSINLLIPFLNGVMLGFGEIFAHELGVLMGWRQAKGYDPSSMPAATNPRARRRWLFGLW